MKKISILLLSVMTLALVSCDMDKEPFDAIPETEALNTPTDFANMRTGLYTGLRSSVGGQTFWNRVDIQCDGFHAVTGFSNTLGDMYRWTFDAETGAMATVYANYQALIARANFIIDGYNKCDMSDEALFTPTAVANVKKAVGDAYFIRAYALLGLAEFFCADYEESNADEADGGVSFRTDYSSSSSIASYPARATLRETFDQIYDDLDKAASYITTEGAPCDITISADAILALRARAALARDDYQTAANSAKALIDKQTFTLAADEDEMIDLWQQDGGNETILQMAVASRDELPGTNPGKIFQPYQEGTVPDYIPTATLLSLYSRGDIRIPAYFNLVDIVTNTGASGTVIGFNKFIDHTRLYTQFNKYEYARFMIEPKVFRIAEMYLIAAEAYAQLNDLTNAAKYLNELQQARISGFNGANYASKDELMAELRDERQREMVGEGTRLFDLKRWHMGIQRGTPQQEDLCLLPGPATTSLVKNANDHKMVWPIPKHETDANPKVKQNPGYLN